MARRTNGAKARIGAFAGAATIALLAFPGMASAAVDADVDNGTLTVSSDAGDPIAITCVGNQIKVNGADPTGNGSCEVLTAIDVTGGPDANAIDLAGVRVLNATAPDTDFPAITSVTIDGAGGNDTIAGSEHEDQMVGGEGNDRISGDDNDAGTRDEFDGQNGDDTLVWNPGDDDDTMEGGPGADTIEVNGGGGPEQFAVKPSPTAGRVQFDRTGPTPPGPFNLDIGTAERLDMNAGGGDDEFDAEQGLDALAFRLDVDGGAGNDRLDGGDGADLIVGGEGDDRINADDNPVGTRDDARGDAGNDTLIWNGGDDDDLNEGGDGTDTIEVNGAAAPEEFTIKPSATAGRILFDRLTTPPGPFNLDIGTSERLDLNAGAGDDKVTADRGFETFSLDVDGGDGNDTLDGGDAADLLAGGEGDDRIEGDDNPLNTRDESQGGGGNDVMVWNPGDDDDINEGGPGDDTTEVNGGTGPEQFRVKPSATAGRVQFDRTGPTPPGPFNVDIGTTENLLLNASGGDDRIKGASGLASLIKSTFNGDEGNDRITGTDGEDALSGGKGIDIIKARDKAEDAVECNGGIDLALVDRRDRVRGCELVLGGRLRVKAQGKVLEAAGGAAALKLRCVATSRCKGAVRLKRNGKTLARGSFKMTDRKVKTVSLKLTRRGRRLVANAPAKGARVKLQIDARDARGNGWRTTAKVRIKG